MLSQRLGEWHDTYSSNPTNFSFIKQLYRI